MRIGITGGSGSLGTALIEYLLEQGIGPIVTASRDEVKADSINRKYGGINGHVRCATIDAGLSDIEKYEELFRGCEVLIHAAALKRVDRMSIYGTAGNMVTANIIGTWDMLRMATRVGIGRVLVISSDKASSPINAYGGSKYLAECLAVEQNAFSYPRGTRISVARWGNCLGSRGSVVHVWREAVKHNEPVRLTSAQMSRFWVTLRQAAIFVLDWMQVMRGGEIFVPRLPSGWLASLADAILEEAESEADVEVLNKRRPGGEKLHEQLLNEEEVLRTISRKNYFVVTPSIRSWSSEPYPGEKVAPDFVYRSDVNDWWLTVDDFKRMLKEVP